MRLHAVCACCNLCWGLRCKSFGPRILEARQRQQLAGLLGARAACTYASVLQRGGPSLRVLLCSNSCRRKAQQTCVRQKEGKSAGARRKPRVPGITQNFMGSSGALQLWSGMPLRPQRPQSQIATPATFSVTLLSGPALLASPNRPYESGSLCMTSKGPDSLCQLMRKREVLAADRWLATTGTGQLKVERITEAPPCFQIESRK